MLKNELEVALAKAEKKIVALSNDLNKYETSNVQLEAELKHSKKLLVTVQEQLLKSTHQAEVLERIAKNPPATQSVVIHTNGDVAVGSGASMNGDGEGMNRFASTAVTGNRR